MSELSKIISKTYQNRLKKERETKGLYDTIYIPEDQKSLKLLPIQNLFYGNDQCPPRLEILLEHIKKINDMEEGAFFIGGNLFYYPAGNTEKKKSLAKGYIDDISEILRVADKDKILFMYNGVNEGKFINDRTLKYPIETSKIVAQNLGIEDKYYDDNKAEITFVFNNSLTNYKSEILKCLFSSQGPISATTNAITTKLNNLAKVNNNKSVIVDTSSSKFYTKKKIVNRSQDPLTSVYQDLTLISTAGYTPMPQIASSKKTEQYVINQRYIELKIETKNPALHQNSTRETNTIKDDEFDRTATCLTIGVDYDLYFDGELYSKLNNALFENINAKEELKKDLERLLDNDLQKTREEIYSQIEQKQKPSEPEKSKYPAPYVFE